MILVDTSVWVDHLRKGSPQLATLLTEGRVVCHTFVIGELACGNLKNRAAILSLLTALPAVTLAGHSEVMGLVVDRNLHGKGLGWIDVHLLTSCLLSGCALWTADKALTTAARSLHVMF